MLVQADRDDVGADSGAVSAPAWLAHATRTSTASGHRDRHLADTGRVSRCGGVALRLSTGIADTGYLRQRHL